MIENNETIDVEETAPAVSKRLPLVGFLSGAVILLLVVLGGVAVGGYSFYKKNTLLQAETRAAKEEVKRKTVALEDMTAQIEALSRQMRALKEHAEARSRKSESATDVPAVLSPETTSADSVSPAKPPEKEKTIVPEVKAPIVQKFDVPISKKQSEGKAQDCNLIGKTPEEREATLKRCVSAMESVSAKPDNGRAAGSKR